MGAIETAVTAESRKVCEKHGEYEVRAYELMGKVFRSAHCPKCIEEQEAARKAEEAAQQAERVRRAWEAKIGGSGIPERFQSRTLASYAPSNDGQRQALAFAQAYVQGFEDNPGRGALFLGLPGTGKTHLAVGVALELMRQGYAAMFCTVMRAVRTVKETWRRDSEQSEAGAIRALVFPDLLVLDEVGVQFGSEAEKLILFDVLNERYERCKATILMSNLTAAEVKDYLGERVMDRMREDGGKVVVFNWESYRGRA